MKKIILILLMLMHISYAKIDYIDYNVFKSFSKNIDLESIHSTKEIFFGLKDNFNHHKISKKYISTKQGKKIATNLAKSILYNMNNYNLVDSKKDIDDIKEYLRVIEITNIYGEKTLEYILILTKNNKYNKYDIKQISIMENEYEKSF